MNQRIHPFKIGDVVKCIDAEDQQERLELDAEYVVLEATNAGEDMGYEDYRIKVFESTSKHGFFVKRFEKVSEFILQVRRANGIDI